MHCVEKRPRLFLYTMLKAGSRSVDGKGIRYIAWLGKTRRKTVLAMGDLKIIKSSRQSFAMIPRFSIYRQVRGGDSGRRYTFVLLRVGRTAWTSVTRDDGAVGS